MAKTNTRVSVRSQNRDLLRVAALATLVALFSFLFYFHRGQILLYGDAVAHLNIARRVFDSQTPGLLQLGTVWLPLPHLLMIPFLLSDAMWQSGIGGSIPSMIAYVLAAIGIFRLVRGILGASDRTRSRARVGAWVAAIVFVANPNLIYLQTTAMTETLYLALFVWAVVYFTEFVQGLPEDARQKNAPAAYGSLFRCAGCLAAAELTRYDGWFLAATMGAVVMVLAVCRFGDYALRLAALKFLLASAVAPVLWLGYNAAVYGNALEFANGPYSAKAILQRTGAINPAQNHVAVAASYFLKSAQLNMATANWGRLWLALAVAAMFFAIARLHAQAPALLLLWVPLVFYALSIARGGVPLYVPVWWPLTLYNIRYGLQLLPLFSVSAGILIAAILGANAPSRQRLAGIAFALVLVVLSYASVWSAQPLCFQEAWLNSRTRLALESAVARVVREMPANSRFLMYLGDHVGVFQQAGIPLRQVLNEGNRRPWKKPSDPEGLWERALADPARYVDFAIAFDGDAVAQAVAGTHLSLLTEIHTTGQPQARIYAARTALNQSR